MKKGFTLVELLGVLIILGVIVLMTVPIIKSQITNSKQELYEQQITYIKQGLKNWAHNNVFLLPETEESITLTVGQLQQLGNLELEIKNPKTNKCISNSSLLTISKRKNNYIYDVKQLNEINCNLNSNVPTIDVDGIIEYVNVGETFTENVTAKSSNGTNITSSIVRTGNSITTSSEGYYQITYTVEDNGRSMTAVKNVFVKNNMD